CAFSELITTTGRSGKCQKVSFSDIKFSRLVGKSNHVRPRLSRWNRTGGFVQREASFWKPFIRLFATILLNEVQAIKYSLIHIITHLNSRCGQPQSTVIHGKGLRTFILLDWKNSKPFGTIGSPLYT